MERAEALKVAASNASVSDKIRALDAAGYPRAEIAKLLDKRYQHVRNVLEGDKLGRTPRTRASPIDPAVTGAAEAGSRFEADSAPSDVEARSGGGYRLTVREDGSIVLPPAVREAFGLALPGVVMARMDGDELKIISTTTAVRRVQEILKPYRWTGGPLASDELIAERRAEAAREGE